MANGDSYSIGVSSTDVIVEIFPRVSCLVGSVPYEEGWLAQLQSTHSLWCRRADKALLSFGGLASRESSKRPVWSSRFESAIPCGGSYMYVGPQSKKNLSGLSLEMDDGSGQVSTCKVPANWCLAMGGTDLNCLLGVFQAFLEIGVLNEGGHVSKAGSHELTKDVKGSSVPWAAALKLVVAPRSEIDSRSYDSLVVFMRKFPFLGWDGSMCYCSSSVPLFPTIGTSAEDCAQLIHSRDSDIIRRFLGLPPLLAGDEVVPTIATCDAVLASSSGGCTAHCAASVVSTCPDTLPDAAVVLPSSLSPRSNMLAVNIQTRVLMNAVVAMQDNLAGDCASRQKFRGLAVLASLASEIRKIEVGSFVSEGAVDELAAKINAFKRQRTM